MNHTHLLLRKPRLAALQPPSPGLPQQPVVCGSWLTYAWPVMLTVKFSSTVRATWLHIGSHGGSIHCPHHLALQISPFLPLTRLPVVKHLLAPQGPTTQAAVPGSIFLVSLKAVRISPQDLSVLPPRFSQVMGV